MQLDDRCRFYGILASVALHGAVATAIVWQLTTHAGAAAPAQSRVMVVNLRLSPEDRFAPSRDTADTALPHAQAAQTTPSRAASVSPALTPANLPRPTDSGSAPSTSAAPTTLRETEGASRTDYESVLREHMRPFFAYPEAARPGRLHGTVQVHFSVGRDGRLLGASVQESSGYAVLDAAALDLVRRAQPLPILPRDLPDPLDITLPLEYIPPTMMSGGRPGLRDGATF